MLQPDWGRCNTAVYSSCARCSETLSLTHFFCVITFCLSQYLFLFLLQITSLTPFRFWSCFWCLWLLIMIVGIGPWPANHLWVLARLNFHTGRWAHMRPGAITMIPIKSSDHLCASIAFIHCYSLSRRLIFKYLLLTADIQSALLLGRSLWPRDVFFCIFVS